MLGHNFTAYMDQQVNQTPPPVGAPTPAPIHPASSGLEPNLAAALSYVLGFISGIIFLIISKDSFVRFHAWQAILTSIVTMVLGWVVDAFVSVYWWRVASLWNLLVLVLFIFLIYKAYSKEKYKLPVIGDWAEKFATKS